MKKIFSLALGFFVVSLMLSTVSVQMCASSSEQPTIQWTRTYGGTKKDDAFSVVETSDGGYAIVGETFSFGAGDSDFWLVKTDSAGNMQWNKTYGGACWDGPRSLVETDDGGYLIAGITDSYPYPHPGNDDLWLIKTDSNGNIQWDKTYGGANNDVAQSVIQTADGGYAIAGATHSFGTGHSDFWLIKTDSNGNMQWSKTYGGTYVDDAMSVVQTDDGGYAMAGLTKSFGAGGWDFWLVKTDFHGNMEWSKTYGGTNDDGAFSLVKAGDGGFVIVGSTYSFGAGQSDFWLVKTDSYGNMQWNKTYGGPDDDGAPFTDLHGALVRTVDEGYAIAGCTKSFGAGYEDFWLIKTDSSGNMRWNKTYGGADPDYAHSVIQTSDGGYALAGLTKSFGAGDRDFWLIRLSPRVMPAATDVNPDTLNLASNGEWITAYIELSDGYGVDAIDIPTILLNDSLSVDPGAPTAVGDHDVDGIPDLMVKFNRAAVIEWLGIVDYGDATEKSFEVILVITGEVAGTKFEGADTVRVLSKS